MARHPLPPIVGDSIHGQTRATLMRLHQQSLEKTINSTLTIIENDTTAANLEEQKQQRMHNKKKKKYYPWVQRDSLAQREKIGLEGSRRRQRHDNVLDRCRSTDENGNYKSNMTQYLNSSMAFILTSPPCCVVRLSAWWTIDWHSFHFLFLFLIAGDTSSVIDKFIHHPFAVLYQVDLPFPGYDRDAPTFHWKYDAMIESLISNNPPSSRRSKAESELSPADQSPSPAAPMIGHRMLSRAQRKDIKKVHVPKGIVMQYEGELVDFLDQLTLSDAKDDDEGNREIEGDIPAQPEESSTEDYNWVIIHSADVLDSKPTLAPKVQEQEQESNDNKKFMVEQPQLFLRWDIQDQFLRFVAHALCSFYGLVSFSKTSGDGKRLVYICHPTHLESIGQLTIASKSETTTTATTSHKPPKRQVTLEHIQELPLQELDQLWSKVEPVKVASCPRPEMTFFEYLYPSTRPLF